MPLNSSEANKLLRASWVCLVLAGCASASEENPFQSGGARRGGLIEVLVVNNGYLDMHIYVVQSGQRRSLGMVTGLTQATMTLPRQIVESGRELQLLGDPIGSSRLYVSPFLYAYPGTRIRLTIQNLLSLSTTWVEDGGPARIASSRLASSNVAMASSV